MSEIYQPKQVWRRIFAIFAFLHFAIYSLTRESDQINGLVMAFDILVISFWALGSAAVMDILLAVLPFWGKKKE